MKFGVVVIFFPSSDMGFFIHLAVPSLNPARVKKLFKATILKQNILKIAKLVHYLKYPLRRRLGYALSILLSLVRFQLVKEFP